MSYLYFGLAQGQLSLVRGLHGRGAATDARSGVLAREAQVLQLLHGALVRLDDA